MAHSVRTNSSLGYNSANDTDTNLRLKNWTDQYKMNLISKKKKS